MFGQCIYIYICIYQTITRKHTHTCCFVLCKSRIQEAAVNIYIMANSMWNARRDHNLARRCVQTRSDSNLHGNKYGIPETKSRRTLCIWNTDELEIYNSKHNRHRYIYIYMYTCICIYIIYIYIYTQYIPKYRILHVGAHMSCTSFPSLLNGFWRPPGFSTYFPTCISTSLKRWPRCGGGDGAAQPPALGDLGAAAGLAAGPRGAGGPCGAPWCPRGRGGWGESLSLRSKSRQVEEISQKMQRFTPLTCYMGLGRPW